MKILRIEGAGKMVAVAEKRAEALMAGLDNQSLTLPKQGVPLVDFAYSKYGANTVGLTIFTNTELIKENPDLVRRFVKATVRSFEAAIKDPEAAIKAGQKVKPDLEMALSLEQLKVGIGLMKTDATRSLPTGYFALKDWEDTVELMKKYMTLETAFKAQDFFSNDYLPK